MAGVKCDSCIYPSINMNASTTTITTTNNSSLWAMISSKMREITKFNWPVNTRRYYNPMPLQWWATVGDGGPSLEQHWVNVYRVWWVGCRVNCPYTR